MIPAKGKPKDEREMTKMWYCLYARMQMTCGILGWKNRVWQMPLFKFLKFGDMKIETFVKKNKHQMLKIEEVMNLESWEKVTWK